MKRKFKIPDGSRVVVTPAIRARDILADVAMLRSIGFRKSDAHGTVVRSVVNAGYSDVVYEISIDGGDSGWFTPDELLFDGMKVSDIHVVAEAQES